MKKMITRRQFMAVAGVVAAASALTACGGSSASTAASSAAGSTAASGSTIKVGVMGPLTGDASVYGQAVVNGAALYLKQVNANGGKYEGMDRYECRKAVVADLKEMGLLEKEEP